MMLMMMGMGIMYDGYDGFLMQHSFEVGVFFFRGVPLIKKKRHF